MLILASASPRREALLRQLCIEFRVVVSGAEEVTKSLAPDELALENAKRKARAVAEATGGADPVLGADTVVALDGKIFGKPASESEAKKMLRELAGRVHTVYTGVAVISGENISTGIDSTRVEFSDLTDDMIESYVATGEPMGKAGAYAIQGRAAAFIPRIEGSFSNVVGLPLCLTAKLLTEAGL